MSTLRNLVLFTFALLPVLAPRPVAAQALLTFGAGLNNFAEVPANLSNGSGTLVLALNADGSVTYALTYSGLSSSATVAHIHIAQPGVNGGVVAFLCGGGGKPTCPASGGTVTGSLAASDVSPLPASNALSAIPQGLQPGDFIGAVRAILSGNAYANVHTTNYPGGEIRGQISIK